MIDKFQCQTHTRTIWGDNSHRYDYRVRYFTIGLLCTVFFAVIIVGLVFLGNKAMADYARIMLFTSENSTTTTAAATATSFFSSSSPTMWAEAPAAAKEPIRT